MTKRGCGEVTVDLREPWYSNGDSGLEFNFAGG